MTIAPHQESSEPDETGVSLLLALAFLFAIGILVTAVATFAAGAFTTSYNLGQQRALEANAESAATVAIAYERYTYDTVAFTGPSNHSCMPSGSTIYPTPTGTAGRMTVYCSGQSHNGSPDSRVMQFSVCPVSATATSPPASCSQVDLYATVIFDDLPPNAAPGADTCPTIASPGLNTCGIAMTVQSWDVRTADN